MHIFHTRVNVRPGGLKDTNKTSNKLLTELQNLIKFVISKSHTQLKQ